MAKIKQMISFVLIILAIVIAMQNVDTVKTRILFQDIELPRFLLILCVFAIGFISGKLITFRSLFGMVKNKKK